MPKYLLLKHYTGGPTQLPSHAPMEEWAPDEITAHLDFQREVADMLRENGEFVDAQALSPQGVWVRSDGPDSAQLVTDGPFAETKELIAGWYIIDVESRERAYEVARIVSSAPGKGGQPIHEWLEVRPVMDELPASE